MVASPEGRLLLYPFVMLLQHNASEHQGSAIYSKQDHQEEEESTAAGDEQHESLSSCARGGGGGRATAS